MLLFKQNKSVPPVPAKQVVHLSGFNVPIHIYVERRKGSRISLLKNKINVRLPNYLSQSDRQKELKKLLDWATVRLSKKDIYNKQHLDKDYWNDRSITVMNDHWSLAFHSDSMEKRMRAKVDYSNYTIAFTGNFNQYQVEQINKNVAKMLIKIFQEQYKLKVFNLVSRINDKTINKSLNSVQLKYLNSRWGSCSVKGNINISLRLLLAPIDVIEYVILHELCHLQEMNHSVKFWSLVSQFMPNYKSKERWLKENGHLCDF
ncbi:MAG: M48 family metallopeptidase [Chitinophagales bacterium]